MKEREWKQTSKRETQSVPRAESCDAHIVPLPARQSYLSNANVWSGISVAGKFAPKKDKSRVNLNKSKAKKIFAHRYALHWKSFVCTLIKEACYTFIVQKKLQENCQICILQVCGRTPYLHLSNPLTPNLPPLYLPFLRLGTKYWSFGKHPQIQPLPFNAPWK